MAYNPDSMLCCRRERHWAHAADKLRSDVSIEIKLPRAARGTRPKGLIAAEVQALLRAAGLSGRALARRNYAVVQLLLQAGLRVSEAAALRSAMPSLSVSCRTLRSDWSNFVEIPH